MVALRLEMSGGFNLGIEMVKAALVPWEPYLPFAESFNPVTHMVTPLFLLEKGSAQVLDFEGADRGHSQDP